MTLLAVLQGLGAPAGAVLAGCREFVSEAWRVRKLLGGGMRQAGVLAAAARLGLQHAERTLRRDHDNARRFAEGTSGPRVCWQLTAHLALPSSTAMLVAWAPSLHGHTGSPAGRGSCWDHAMTVPVLCSVTMVPHEGERLSFTQNLGWAGAASSGAVGLHHLGLPQVSMCWTLPSVPSTWQQWRPTL